MPTAKYQDSRPAGFCPVSWARFVDLADRRPALSGAERREYHRLAAAALRAEERAVMRPLAWGAALMLLGGAVALLPLLAA